MSLAENVIQTARAAWAYMSNRLAGGGDGGRVGGGARSRDDGNGGRAHAQLGHAPPAAGSICQRPGHALASNS